MYTVSMQILRQIRSIQHQGLIQIERHLNSKLFHISRTTTVNGLLGLLMGGKSIFFVCLGPT